MGNSTVYAAHYDAAVDYKSLFLGSNTDIRLVIIGNENVFRVCTA